MRDTDADWNEIGHTEPWYGVLATGKFLMQNINAETISEFYASGRQDMLPVVQTIERLFGAGFRPERALDFGCGVGRLCFAMADTAKSVTGIDVSLGMIAKAEAFRNEARVTNVEFKTRLSGDDRFDWINSYIVFQHIPPRRGIVIMEELLTSLNSSGVVSIQLTYFHEQRDLQRSIIDIGDYSFDGECVRVLSERRMEERNAMRMFDYDLSSVFRLFHRNGIDEVFSRRTAHGGSYGVWLFGRKK
jgi:SAM-dependent methyltransferase